MVCSNSICSKSQFLKIWEVVLGSSPHRNADFPVKLHKNDEVELNDNFTLKHQHSVK